MDSQIEKAPAAESARKPSIVSGTMQNADPEAVVSEKILKHSKDGDEALKALALEGGERLVLDKETERRLLRKIDFNLLPVYLPAMAPNVNGD